MNNFLKQKYIYLILFILIFGIIQKIYVTSGGNFLFNMDNARDFVDVREMVELKKPRLTGPTSAIEGLYTGPGWYLLLAIPYVLSDGDPYSAIILMTLLWAVGGFFLMKLISRFGLLAVLASGMIWLGSGYINLATVYSFNPNPVTFLTPLLIFLVDKYLRELKFRYLVGASFLGGLFFNFEMNFGVFILPIIFLSVLLSKKIKLMKNWRFWMVLIIPFGVMLLPQLLFDLKHQFIMSKSVIKFLTEKEIGGEFDLFKRVSEIYGDFYYVILPTFLDSLTLLKGLLLGIILLVTVAINKKGKNLDGLLIICLLTVIVPFISYIILPVEVNGWHLGAEMAALIILFAAALKQLSELHFVGRLVAVFLVIFIVFLGLKNVNGFIESKKLVNNDPSLFMNEVLAVDYIFQKAEGKNFKAYTYLPSVIDYPYQYIFWWHGLKKYGYTPEDYAYAPNKPQYISNKQSFVNPNREASPSGLVFLVKEPDRINIRHLWENIFAKLEIIETKQLPGIEVVTLKDGEFVNF